MSVQVSRDTETLQLGSIITLTATLEGYEGVEYACRWQYAAADRDGNIVGEWQDAEAGTLTMSYELTAANLLTAWRMSVTVLEPAQEAEPVQDAEPAQDAEPVQDVEPAQEVEAEPAQDVLA